MDWVGFFGLSDFLAWLVFLGLNWIFGIELEVWIGLGFIGFFQIGLDFLDWLGFFLIELDFFGLPWIFEICLDF